jgi:hypothetical protein
MLSYQRRAVLSAALDLQPGRELSRDNIEAAIWAALGHNAGESRVALLLMIVDAYSDSRSRKAIHTWYQKGTELPNPVPDMAQLVAVRRAMLQLGSMPAMPPAEADAGYAAARLIKPAAARPTVSSRPSYLAVVSSSSSTGNDAAADDIATDDLADDGMIYRDDEDDDDDEELYRCAGRCNELKPRSGFYNSKSVKRGFEYKCKKCKNAQNKKYRDDKKNRDASRNDTAVLPDDINKFLA